MNLPLMPVDVAPEGDGPGLVLKPTKETYDRFQMAYEHFNKALFDNALPNALITLQRRTGTFGFFASGKFSNRDGQPADEIALNPARFAERTVPEILSTLVHEMVHLWQHHQGSPGRGRYHNREWAERMKAIGLHPTDTGLEGGKETGETVGHIIVVGGPFALAADRLIARDFTIAWQETSLPTRSVGDEDSTHTPEKSGKRVRYCCPNCDLKAWAKHEAKLMCGADMVSMVATE